ncbi:TetR/AcrR family transcriptional regulator [Intrasporangium sp.]|uniref:TetR/AcrR family transcriptional regulator n=1 Tax=Intrasporangium sp. TaxID=1925024 RepID=UPI00293A1582|nr:TetR/AcrR family transcriptional regulator [Intrasporangium sp.]MDV3220683.1 TetR/AcrR family transcriptional regulator [Intrasporangium sp.]
MPTTRRVTRDDLVVAAAGLLATKGPHGLSARALARAVDASTMAVYTHFGSMPAVINAVIAEAFARLDTHLARRLADLDPESVDHGDPFRELHAIALAYRDNALANPHLYVVMFGGPQAIGTALTDTDFARARASLRTVAEAAARARDAGHLVDVDEWELARRLWAAGHGAVLLELGGYLGARESARETYVAVIDAVLAGLSPVAQGSSPG